MLAHLKTKFFRQIFTTIITIIQVSLAFPVSRLIIFLFSIKVRFPQEGLHLSKHKGILFVSNHQSYLDPFLIISSLPLFGGLLSTTPVRFPTTPDYMEKHILSPVATLFGCYSIGSNQAMRMQRLIFTRDILRKGGSLLLFPQGRLLPINTLLENKYEKGVSMLFETKASIIFVKIENFHTFFSSKKKSITFSSITDGGLTKEEKENVMRIFYS